MRTTLSPKPSSSHHRGDGARLSHLPRFDALRFALLLATVPAFYLHLAATALAWSRIGSGLYLIAAMGLAALSLTTYRRAPDSHAGVHRADQTKRNALDTAILAGVIASLFGSAAPWSILEWALRLLLVALIAARLLWCLSPLLTRRETGHALVLGVALLLFSGLGFYWLEPSVKSYGDGLWLAFESGATVGYGDIVPTTPAARLFAAFIVLIGYAMMSLVTASIAAFFIGEDEQQLRRELHRDIKALHDEVRQLRETLQHNQVKP